MVDQGRDPLAERDESAARAAAERSALTVAEALDHFFAERLAKCMWKDTTRRLNESYRGSTSNQRSAHEAPEAD
jgi:hypothetical protein